MRTVSHQFKAAYTLFAASAVSAFLVWKYYDNNVVLRGKLEAVARQDQLEMERSFKPERLKGAAPAFELTSIEGKPVRLADLRGKYVMVNFWATYCAPCLRELPSMYALARKHPDKLAIVAVSVDDSWDPIKDLFEQRIGKLPPFTLALDADSKLAREFGTVKIPETYLIGPDGQLVDKFVADRDWTSPPAEAYFRRLFARN